MGEQKYRNSGLGAILTLIGAALGMGVNSFLFINNYQLYIAEQLAQFPMLTNWKVITYLLPVFSDFAILGGVMYLISVYGFIPPSCREMYEMEDRISGFNEKEFISRFEAAGGVWIDIDPGGYHSFDGSHLRDDAALEYKHDFSMKLLELQEKNSSPAATE